MPGRNLLFFTYAAALAYRRGMRTLVGGMCETDFSGYPDCRNDTLQTLGQAISLGMDAEFIIETPLMWIDKAGTWALAEELGGAPLVELIIEDIAHLLPRHPLAPARVGLRLRALPGVRPARQGMGRMASRQEELSTRRRPARWRRTGRRRTTSPSATKAMRADWLHAVLHKIEGDDGNAPLLVPAHAAHASRSSPTRRRSSPPSATRSSVKRNADTALSPTAGR